MKNIVNKSIILLLLLIIVSDCRSERDRCFDEKDYYDSNISCNGGILLITSGGGQLSKDLYNMLILSCLEAEKIRKECNKKSNIGISDPAD